jgi:hypothetical protein
MTLRHNKRYGRSIRGEFKDLGTGFDFEGVKDIVSDLQYLKENGVYGELFNTFKNWEEPINISNSTHKELQAISPLLTRVMSNNLTPERGNIFSGSIDYFSFYRFYRFLEWVYSINLGRSLQEEDVKAIFSSDILEKIILGLENFPNVPATGLNDDFFHHINEVEWTDKHAERFFDKLHDLLASKSFDDIENREISFKRELKRIVKFLVVCSTVSKGKTYITTIEVISAYKTLFKIIGTDITDLVNKKEYNGLLTCPVCNGYYSLEEDETPHDFVRCSCGGALTYTQSLDDMKHYVKTFKELVIDKKGLIAGAITSLTFALLFDSVLLVALISGITTVLMAKNYTNGFKYGFLTGNISGSLFFIAVFIFGIIVSGIKLHQPSSIGGSTIFMFILVLGVLAIYCGRIGTFLIKGSKNKNIAI